MGHIVHIVTLSDRICGLLILLILHDWMWVWIPVFFMPLSHLYESFLWCVCTCSSGMKRFNLRAKGWKSCFNLWKPRFAWTDRQVWKTIKIGESNGDVPKQNKDDSFISKLVKASSPDGKVDLVNCTVCTIAFLYITGFTSVMFLNHYTGLSQCCGKLFKWSQGRKKICSKCLTWRYPCTCFCGNGGACDVSACVVHEKSYKTFPPPIPPTHTHTHTFVNDPSSILNPSLNVTGVFPVTCKIYS